MIRALVLETSFSSIDEVEKAFAVNELRNSLSLVHQGTLKCITILLEKSKKASE